MSDREDAGCITISAGQGEAEGGREDDGDAVVTPMPSVDERGLVRRTASYV